MRPRRKWLLVLAGATALAVLAAGGALTVVLFQPLNTTEADPNSKVGGPKPPKEVPRPPESDLSLGGEVVASAPTFWCKIIQSTGFCRGEEGLLLPPGDEILEATAGAALTFRFGGPGVPRAGRGWRVPGNAPIYVGAERIDEDTETRFGPGGISFVKSEPFPGRPLGDVKTRRAESGTGERFLIQAALPPGEYVFRVVARTPGLEAYYHFRVRLTASTRDIVPPTNKERPDETAA